MKKPNKNLKFQIKTGFQIGLSDSENKRKFTANMLKYSENFMKKRKVSMVIIAQGAHVHGSLVIQTCRVMAYVIALNAMDKTLNLSVFLRNPHILQQVILVTWPLPR